MVQIFSRIKCYNVESTTGSQSYTIHAMCVEERQCFCCEWVVLQLVQKITHHSAVGWCGCSAVSIGTEASMSRKCHSAGEKGASYTNFANHFLTRWVSALFSSLFMQFSSSMTLWKIFFDICGPWLKMMRHWPICMLWCVKWCVIRWCEVRVVDQEIGFWFDFRNV